MLRNRRKVKNLLLNPSYQLKYVLLTAGAGLLVALVNAAVFYSYTKENYSILVDLAPMTDAVKTQLYAELRQIIMVLTLSSVAFVGVVTFLSLLLSHRTAGPLYHFKRVFEDIRRGDHASRIHLRPKDDFHEVANSFNSMMDDVLKSGKTSAGSEGTERRPKRIAS